MRKFFSNSLNRLFGRRKPVILESELAKHTDSRLLVDPNPTTVAPPSHIIEDKYEQDPISKPFDYELEPTVYELPIVPVVKRKSKTRGTAKTIRKSRKRIARKARK